jgi:hypothetical protein
MFSSLALTPESPLPNSLKAQIAGDNIRLAWDLLALAELGKLEVLGGVPTTLFPAMLVRDSDGREGMIRAFARRQFFITRMFFGSPIEEFYGRWSEGLGWEIIL